MRKPQIVALITLTSALFTGCASSPQAVKEPASPGIMWEINPSLTKEQGPIRTEITKELPQQGRDSWGFKIAIVNVSKDKTLVSPHPIIRTGGLNVPDCTLIDAYDNHHKAYGQFMTNERGKVTRRYRRVHKRGMGEFLVPPGMRCEYRIPFEKVFGSLSMQLREIEYRTTQNQPLSSPQAPK